MDRGGLEWMRVDFRAIDRPLALAAPLNR